MKFIFTNVSYLNMESFGFVGDRSPFLERQSDYENIVLDYAGCEIIKIDKVTTGCYDIEFEDGHKIHGVCSSHIKCVVI